MKLVQGIWLPDGDTHFADQIAKNPLFEGRGTYQYKKIEAALRVAAGRRVALDIGAHVGLWSRVLAKCFDKVVAFEPVPALIECFFINTAECENIRLIQAAASEQEGELFIDIVDGNSGNCRVANPPGKDSLFIGTVTVDSFGFDEVDLIKIDVEGWELRVLEGTEQTIKRCRPVVVVEQKPGNAERYGFKRTEAVDLLRSWGMKDRWEMSGDYCLAWD